MRIRRLDAKDKPDWLRLFQAYIDFYQARVAQEVIEQTWTRCLNQEDGFLALVAADDTDRVCGIAHLLFHASTWSPTTYCYLEDLFVDPSRRRAGAGRALIDAVYKEADARGCTRTYWMTQEGNQTARSLYDRLATKSPFVQYRR